MRKQRLKQKFEFGLKIEGDGVSPQSIAISDLFAIISGVEQAILETAGRPTGGVVSLVGISTGSSCLALAIDEGLKASARKVDIAIARRRFEKLPKAAHEALAETSKKLAAKGWTFRIPEDRSAGLREAVISPDLQIFVPEVIRIRGRTTVYGKLIRVGGDDPKAILRIDERIVNVAISEEQARQLAHSLYETVGIEGDAEWDKETSQVVQLKATRVLSYRQRRPADVFRELSEIAKGAFDGVDAVKFVRQQRGA